MTKTSVLHRPGMTRSQRLAWFIARTFVVTFAKIWFRYEVHGAENLPTGGAFILCPNHRSNLDTPLLPVIRRDPIRFMGKESLWEVGKAAGWFLDTMGGFPVERDSADRVALRLAEGILENGEPLVMFPEGTRQTGPIVQEENMHSGPSFLAGRQQVPIIPIGVAGSEAAMPTGSKFVYPKKITFVIGEPLNPPMPNDRGRVSRRAVQEHTVQLRDRIQELFDQAAALRR